MEGYLGQVRRSKVKVTRSKNVSMGISMECLLRNRLSNMTVRNSTMWGVFKVYAFFIYVITPNLSDMTGVIILTCYHSDGRMDRHTDLNFGMEVKWEDI